MTQLNRLLATALLAGLATFAVTGAARADALADYRAGVMADTPLAYWHLDEAAGTNAADASGNGRTGTFAGGVTLGAGAPFMAPANTAVRFDTTGGMTAQVPGTTTAVEFWVKPSQRVQQTFVTFGDPQTSSGWSVGLSGTSWQSSQRRRLRFTSGGRVTSARVTLPIGSWSMVSVTWGPGTTVKFFVNGSTSTRTPWSGGIPSSSGTLGTLKVGPGAGTGGTTVDEVALYATRPDPAKHFKPSALPVVVTPPAVSAPPTPAVGTPITVTPGTWSAGTTVTDVWQRCDSIGACQTISGATGTTYTPTVADAGFTLQLQETAVSPTGTIVVSTDQTEPIALADGTQPPSAPLLPPGTDPSVPAAESQAAIDGGGVTVVDPAASETSGGTPPATTAPGGGAPVATAAAHDGGVIPASGAEAAGACVARSVPSRAQRLKLRRMGRRGRVTVKLDGATGVITVRAKHGTVKRVRWTLDGTALAAGRGTAMRLPMLMPGSHVLSGRVAPRRGSAATVTLRFTSAC